MNEGLSNLSLLNKTGGNLKEYCKEHGEEVSYYCFDCNCKCICSECAIHGFHKNHEVMKVKRAYPLIYNKSEDLLITVQNRVEEIYNLQEALELRKTDLLNSTNSIKSEVSKMFEEIRIKLQKKEKEILEKAELQTQEHLQTFNTYLRIIKSKIISLNKLTQSISSNLSRKDEVNLLNFYSESKNPIFESLHAEMPEIPDLHAVYNINIKVNQDSLQTLINNLNAIQMEITSTRGVEIKKVANTKKFAVNREVYGVKTNFNEKNNKINNSSIKSSWSNDMVKNSEYEIYRNNKMNSSFNSHVVSCNGDFSERIKKI